MLQRTYDRVMGLAAHRHAIWWLAAISFIESSVFPIPPDVMLIPMVLVARARALMAYSHPSRSSQQFLSGCVLFVRTAG